IVLRETGAALAAARGAGLSSRTVAEGLHEVGVAGLGGRLASGHRGQGGGHGGREGGRPRREGGGGRGGEGRGARDHGRWSGPGGRSRRRGGLRYEVLHGLGAYFVAARGDLQLALRLLAKHGVV